ncbi:MAG: ABC transporter ATP-binding protein [Anaerolineaceae bacterium]
MQLVLDRLTKQYKNKIALDRVCLTLNTGVYGLLGANGAGKTTMMRMICDILRPSSGEVLFDGKEINTLGESYRSILGYLPQDFGYYPGFTAFKFMLYISSLKGLNANYAKERSLELLDLVGLSDVRNQKIKTFSGGMRQRLGIAQAMLNDPEILILDEPTAGLDPKERVHFRNLISSFSKDKIVLLSTHIVSDVEHISKEVLILKNGKLLHQGTAENIIREIDGYVWECEVAPDDVDAWNSRYVVSNLKHENGKAILRVVSENRPAENAVSVVPGLEDLYLYYFKGEEK